MSNFNIAVTLVTEDGGLTRGGYALFLVLAVLALLVGSFLAGKLAPRKKLSARQLVFCAMALALGFVTSYIKLIHLPLGGSVTLFSMLFIVLVGWWYGPSTGILVAFAYGILQFLQGPYVLSLFQVCCDYLLAFAMLGLSGFFYKKKHGLPIGYLVAVIARGAFHALGGYLYWMEYMPETFPAKFAPVYPIVYNFAYIGLEALITLVLISLPPVRKALAQVKRLAVGENGESAETAKPDERI